MRKASIIVMTLAGLLLIVASILKFYELLTTCIPSWTDNVYGIWESYEFFLIQIPLEFALGVWLVSGLFRKAAWIAGTLAYFGFIFVTIFKAVTGAESCGCFGQVVVNPWITLFSIDVPFFLLLLIFRPKGLKLLPPPWPNTWHLLAVAVPTIGLMVLSTPVLVAFKPDCKKAEEVQPDESAKKALQDFLKKQQDAPKQPQLQAEPLSLSEPPVQPEVQSPPATETDEYTYGKLSVKATEQADIFTVQINQKQAFALNIADSDKILITPLNPVNQQLVLLPNGVEVNWQTEPVTRPVAVGDPNVTVETIAREQDEPAPSDAGANRDDSSFDSSGFAGEGPIIPPAPMNLPAGETSGFSADADTQPATESIAADPNLVDASQSAAEPKRQWTAQSESPAGSSNTEPNTSDPETVEPNAVEQGEAQSTADNNSAEPKTTQPADEIAQWEWLQYVAEDNLRAEMARGLTVVLMYHHDCPTCAEMAPKYSDYCRQMAEQGNEEFKIVFLAVPPYAEYGPIPSDTACLTGKLTEEQNWQIMSPYVVALLDGQLVKTWKQGTAPEPDNIIDEIMSD